MNVALLAAALLVGCLLAVQSSVNLQLNGAVKTPYGASTVQLSVATILLAIVALAAGTIGAVSLVSDVTWWHLLGGLASPLYITSGILLFPRLGALAAVGLFVTGQMFASLALDLFGLIGIPREPLSIGIVLGAIAVLVGITMIIRQPAAKPVAPSPAAQPDAQPAGKSLGAMVKPASPVGVGRIGWIILGIVAGAVLPIQGAVNAQLRAELKAPITVAMISFIVATITIAIVLLVLLALRRTPTPQFKPLARMPWWGWLGGACAAAYVTATFLLIPEIGAATTVALTVTGQQLASAVIDGFGLFRMPKRPLTTRRITGLALLIAGSILVQLA
ncbi:transporter family-2 protein [Kibdelosporangium banguiense]|uniref:Transporter family-2 protein n=1 Tax=Kibdelosporangium banguiense TaxID=1365924 RepID=A0ABS4TWH8_9PSEU|nr:DMT family transporter [Kibdelosporangium banguiense]MBP2328752.1 transporter family-2 protein [Kibdelosporangium banguiense]